ncbi:MAG: PAS domain-containing protein, partial [Oscillospiraceae bacterium]
MKNFQEMKATLESLSLPIGLLIVEAGEKLQILFANEIFLEMLGYEEQEEFLEASAYSAWNFVYPEDVEKLKKAAGKRSGKFDPYEIIYRVVKKNGKFLWINQNSRHTVDENG